MSDDTSFLGARAFWVQGLLSHREKSIPDEVMVVNSVTIPPTANLVVTERVSSSVTDGIFVLIFHYLGRHKICTSCRHGRWQAEEKASLEGVLEASE